MMITVRDAEGGGHAFPIRGGMREKKQYRYSGGMIRVLQRGRLEAVYT